MISQQDLGPEVVSLGVLLGLLTESGDNVTVNQDWFKNPLAPNSPSLDNAGQRLNQLVAFIEASLGQGAKNPPPVFTGAQWYAIPNPGTGASSPFYIVAPAQTATTGQIGFGVLYSMQSGNLTTTLYAYVPLFSYDPSGATFITDSTTYPCQVGLRATTSDNSKFTADGVTFTAMDVTAAIYLNPAAYEGNTATPFLTLEFENLTGTTKSNTYHSLSDLLDPVVDTWIAAVILTGSTWLNLYIGQSSITVGNVLVAVNFLTRDDNGNYSLNLSTLEGQSAKEIVLNFVFGILNVLSDGGTPVALIGLPGGGLYIASQQNSDGSSDYGLRLAVDITLVSGQSASGGSSPKIDLSLGTWLTGEDEGNNWLVRSLGNKLSDVPPPGVTIFVVHYDNQANVSFAPSFSLTSVGVNIAGGAGTPLINLNGYTLQGIELRTYLAYHAGWAFGAAARLDGFGFPLGPNFGSAVKSTDTNPVAQSLLQSGSGTSGGSDKNPVNPAFSVSAAYVEQGTFVVQL